MDRTRSIVKLADRFVLGEVELEELDALLAEEADGFASRSDDDLVAQLAGLIDVTLAEMDGGHATEDDLRARLTTFFVHHGLWWSHAAKDAPPVSDGSDNRTSEITSDLPFAAHTTA